MSEHRRGLRRWIWIAVITLPPAAILLGYLWLASPLGRGWVAGKIQRRTGLEARIGSLSVTPWDGIRLGDVTLLQPAALRPHVKPPLAHIQTIRLTPIWKTWIRGNRELREIALDSPQIVLPIELLADLSRRPPPPTGTAPQIAAATPAPVQPPPFVGPPAPAPIATSPTSPTPPPTAATPATQLPPTAWLHLKNASFTLISAPSGKKWLELSRLDTSLPIAGRAARSSLELGSLQTAGQQALDKLSAELEWQPPLLSLKPLQTTLLGYQVTVAGKIGLLSGLPLQIEAQLADQPFTSLTLPRDGLASAETVNTSARFRGLLLAPGTWQGDLLANARAPSGKFAGHEAEFDQASMVTVLRGGVLSCVDARLIGDELSFLGNATVLADGRAAAALRVVAPPENAAAIASRMFPNIQASPPLTPLSTPQRSALDLEAFGTINQLFLRLGRGGPVIQLKH